MVLVVFASVTWVILALFMMLPNKLDKQDNTFFFMVLILLNCNGSWIFIEEMKAIKLASPLPANFSFLLFRTIIPYSIMLCQNIWLSSVSWQQKSIMTITVYTFLTVMEWVGLQFSVYEFEKWHLVYSVVFYIFLQIATFVLYKWYQHAACKEE
ncbi:hypothetical protein LOK74_18015 [Brevibacillus humidisoli]|uniref:hypothetical protein n=1 Tax=Brevibacillus humidisoli TaxID=2895522 RepID=UPI001E4DCEF4|nr:hypothetical protein [Brevibacillus humidisoli]UFJ39927.1 hypothetical protein LOK74_18015 [Brevibacillus humidisoli]